MKYQISQEGVIYTINDDNTVTKYGRVLADGSLEGPDGRRAPGSLTNGNRRPGRGLRAAVWILAAMLIACGVALWFTLQNNEQLRSAVGELDGTSTLASARIDRQSDTIAQLTEQLQTANRSRQEATASLEQLTTSLQPNMPMVITGVRFRNVTVNRQPLSDYGAELESNDLLYLEPELHYYGLTQGASSLGIRIIMPNGQVRATAGNPYTYVTSRPVDKRPDGVMVLPGYGSSSPGSWMPGNYVFEVYYNGGRIYRSTFAVE